MSALPPAHSLGVAAALDELALYLRPPGQGIHAVSTGRAALEAATRAYLGAGWDPALPWRVRLEQALTSGARVALLGVPSDTGAGIVRGAAWGPTGIREALGSAPALDLGDVFVVPQLLDDEMHGAEQLARSRLALYGGVEPARRAMLPVAPISITRRVIALVRAIAPHVRLLVLGGDHTVAWPVVAELLAPEPEDNRDVAIVHFDAHTDLLPERLGVRYCFATWAYHANVRLGRGQRLLQLGIRASAKDRAHWERTEDVRQIWGPDAAAMTPDALAGEVVDHLRRIGARRVYVSNDIDGTDAYFAAACGTPEPGGLHPDQVVAVLEALRGRFAPIGADVVEVAPGLSLDRDAAARTLATAARYVRASVELLAGD
jgi:agmatinase